MEGEKAARDRRKDAAVESAARRAAKVMWDFMVVLEERNGEVRVA